MEAIIAERTFHMLDTLLDAMLLAFLDELWHHYQLWKRSEGRRKHHRTSPFEEYRRVEEP